MVSLVSLHELNALIFGVFSLSVSRLRDCPRYVIKEVYDLVDIS